MTDVVPLFTARAATYQRFIEVLRYRRGLAALVDRGGYLRPGARVLDAGCGTGAFTGAVHEVAERRRLAGVRYHAFDLTPAMIAHLQTWARAGSVDVATLEADVTRLDLLPPDWRGFDLVVSSAMLEYLPPAELPVALSQLAALLAPTGTLVVCITRQNLLMRGLIGAWWQSHLYIRAAIDQAFRDGGLTPLFVRFPGGYRYLDLWGHAVVVSGAAPPAPA